MSYITIHYGRASITNTGDGAGGGDGGWWWLAVEMVEEWMEEQEETYLFGVRCRYKLHVELSYQVITAQCTTTIMLFWLIC